MAEYANPAIVNVTPGQNVPLLDVIGGNCGIVHRGGSGLITLRGNTNQCKARYRVAFGANIAIPEGGTVEAITAALAINGEALTTATATVTPAAAENFSISMCPRLWRSPRLLRDRGGPEHQHPGC